MKIKVTKMAYQDVLKLPAQRHQKPEAVGMFFRKLIRLLSKGELKKVGFRVTKTGMEKLPEDAPCLVLMNHSSFIDLKIASTLLYPKSFHIVCTSDGFVGKDGLMRKIGCIPTRKFQTDTTLVRDMIYALHTLKSSVLMYPEASYSFDGTATPLPDSLGKCIKLLKVPVVMIKTCGAFSRDPLYNNLQLRDVPVSAEMKYLLSVEDIADMSAQEINEVLQREFTFDHFKWQQENHIKIDEPFRADYLNRVLYKCPHCLTEGKMTGKGIKLTCTACGKEYELTEEGFMQAKEGETEFSHIPDWYAWERDCVREELQNGTYHMETDVIIRMMVDHKSIYEVGKGVLTHDEHGFKLTGCDGEIAFEQSPLSSYGLYSDYFWYELGDMICIGDAKALYYCFPPAELDLVAKTRLAAEELYKLVLAKKAQEKTDKKG